jgi:hypothetical protein
MSGAFSSSDTPPRPQIKTEPDMRADVMYRAGPPASPAIEARAPASSRWQSTRAASSTPSITINEYVVLYHAGALEIGDIPSAPRGRSLRGGSSQYYRVTERYHLDVRQYQWVKTVTGMDGVSNHCNRRPGAHLDYRPRKSSSTGYYDLSNPLNIPGRAFQSVSLLSRAASVFDMDVSGDGARTPLPSPLSISGGTGRATLVHRGPKLPIT